MAVSVAANLYAKVG